MRAVHETTAMDAYANGDITLAENLAFKKVNGHSSSIAKQYYERTTMSTVASSAMRGFAIMSGTPRAELIEDHVSSSTLQTHLPRWGTSHSCQDMYAQRACWDQVELDMVLIVCICCLLYIMSNVNSWSKLQQTC